MCLESLEGADRIELCRAAREVPSWFGESDPYNMDMMFEHAYFTSGLHQLHAHRDQHMRRKHAVRHPVVHAWAGYV